MQLDVVFWRKDGSQLQVESGKGVYDRLNCMERRVRRATVGLGRRDHRWGWRPSWKSEKLPLSVAEMRTVSKQATGGEGAGDSAPYTSLVHGIQ